MRIVKCLIAASICITCAGAFADTESSLQAEAMLSSIGMEKMFNQTIEKSLDMQLKQNPSMQPYKAVMQRFFAKYMSYESLKTELVDLYAKAFTAQELKEINAFYRTQTGAKAIALMPELFAKGSDIGTQHVQSHVDELKAMISEEAARIQELQSKK